MEKMNENIESLPAVKWIDKLAVDFLEFDLLQVLR